MNKKTRPKTTLTATPNDRTRHQDLEASQRRKRRSLDRRAFAGIRKALHRAEALLQRPGMTKREARIHRADFARVRRATATAEAWLQICDSPELQSLIGVDQSGAEQAARRQIHLGIYHLARLHRGIEIGQGQQAGSTVPTAARLIGRRRIGHRAGLARTTT